MDDLGLLKELPGRIEPPDVETKERMRAVMEVRTTPSSVRHPRRVARIAVLGVAAVLVTLGLAAGIAIHAWTADDPVALQGIPDPTGPVSTPEDLQSVVAEFAPAIRLPDGGSFDVWIQRQEANPESSLGRGLNRTVVAHSMVFVSQCQWAQQWLDASDRSDHAGAAQAIRVLDGVNDWWRSNAPGDDYGTGGLLARMQSGDRAGVQSLENGCGYTGSWGTTPAQQDAKAMGTLSPAAQIAEAYLRDGGDPARFDPSMAGTLDPSIGWTWSHFQPTPAGPGYVFIAPSTDEALTLVSASESGTQFCAVVTHSGVQHGTTTDDLSTVENSDGTAVNARYPGPVSCTPGGW
jgi:hypothetical protein